MLMTLLGRLGAAVAARRRSSRPRRRAVDEILFAEIARRRAAPDLDQRDDVFSMLLLAEDEDGASGLSDQRRSATSW